MQWVRHRSYIRVYYVNNNYICADIFPTILDCWYDQLTTHLLLLCKSKTVCLQWPKHRESSRLGQKISEQRVTWVGHHVVLSKYVRLTMFDWSGVGGGGFGASGAPSLPGLASSHSNVEIRDNSDTFLRCKMLFCPSVLFFKNRVSLLLPAEVRPHHFRPNVSAHRTCFFLNIFQDCIQSIGHEMLSWVRLRGINAHSVSPPAR